MPVNSLDYELLTVADLQASQKGMLLSEVVNGCVDAEEAEAFVHTKDFKQSAIGTVYDLLAQGAKQNFDSDIRPYIG